MKEKKLLLKLKQSSGKIIDFINMYIFINFKMGSVSRVGEQNGCLALLSNGILKRHSFKIPFEKFKIHSQNELYESVDTSLVKIHPSIRAVHGGITCVHDRVPHSVMVVWHSVLECGRHPVTILGFHNPSFSLSVIFLFSILGKNSWYKEKDIIFRLNISI
uniref:Uncharacterized protein n=1 Tax=Cacopsylla melanoneura TaxID=428564 RepID=A0A8D8WM21_9HEMI